MANRQFLGSTNSDFATAANWDGGLSVPSAGDNLQISAACVLAANDANTYGTLLIDSTKTFTIQTFNFNCGAVTHTGALTIGVSAGTGLTCAGLTSGTAATLSLGNSSKISTSNGINYGAVNVLVSSSSGMWTFTSSANFSNTNAANGLRQVTINSGVTLTMQSGTNLFGSTTANSFTNNGTIATASGSNIQIGMAATGSITFGSASDITGGGLVTFLALDGCTFTNSKSGAFSNTLVNTPTSSTNNFVLPGWDFSNADATINASTATVTRYLGATGATALKVKSLACSTATGGQTTTINTAKYNTSITCANAFTLTQTDGTLTWSKGTGTITFNGSSGSSNLTFNNASLEDLIFSATGKTYNVTDGQSTVSLSGTGGTVQSSSAGTQRTITVTSTGVCSGMTFKDISMGSANKVNAKSSCTNNGNNLGIVFTDTFTRHAAI